MKISALKNIEKTQVSHNPNIKKQLLISNGEIKNITHFSQTVFPPGETAPAHSHSDMTEVFFIQSGQGSILVDQKLIPLEQGMCITVEPGEVHELKNTGETELHVTYFGVIT